LRNCEARISVAGGSFAKTSATRDRSVPAVPLVL
jgi:hypothetical protein